jgi:hypothetical protein
MGASMSKSGFFVGRSRMGNAMPIKEEIVRTGAIGTRNTRY